MTIPSISAAATNMPLMPISSASSASESIYSAWDEDLIRLGKMVSYLAKANVKRAADFYDFIPHYELFSEKYPTPEVHILTSEDKKTIVANWTPALMSFDEDMDINDDVEYTLTLTDTNTQTVFESFLFPDTAEFVLVTADSSVVRDRNEPQRPAQRHFMIFQKLTNSTKVEAFHLLKDGPQRFPDFDFDISSFHTPPKWGLFDLQERSALNLINSARLYKSEGVSGGYTYSKKFFTLNVANLAPYEIEAITRTIFKALNHNGGDNYPAASAVANAKRHIVHQISTLMPFRGGKEGDTLFFYENRTTDIAPRTYRMIGHDKVGTIDDYTVDFPLSRLQNNPYVCRMVVDKEGATAQLNDIPALFFKRLPQKEVLSLIHDFIMGKKTWEYFDVDLEHLSHGVKEVNRIFEDRTSKQLIYFTDEQNVIIGKFPFYYSDCVYHRISRFKFSSKDAPYVRINEDFTYALAKDGSSIFPLTEVTSTINPCSTKLHKNVFMTPLWAVPNYTFTSFLKNRIKVVSEEALKLRIPKVLIQIINSYLNDRYGIPESFFNEDETNSK